MDRFLLKDNVLRFTADDLAQANPNHLNMLLHFQESIMTPNPRILEAVNKVKAKGGWPLRPLERELIAAAMRAKISGVPMKSGDVVLCQFEAQQTVLATPKTIVMMTPDGPHEQPNTPFPLPKSECRTGAVSLVKYAVAFTEYSEYKVVQGISMIELIKIGYRAVRPECIDQFAAVMDCAVAKTSEAIVLAKVRPRKASLRGLEYTSFISKAISQMNENDYQCCHSALLEVLSPCFVKNEKGDYKAILIQDPGVQAKVVVANPCKTLDPKLTNPFLLIGPVGTKRLLTPTVAPTFLEAQKKLTESRAFRGSDERGLSLVSTNHKAGVRVSKLVRFEQRVLTVIMALTGPCDVTIPRVSSVPRLCSILDLYKNEFVRFVVPAAMRESFTSAVQLRTVLMPDRNRIQVIFTERSGTSNSDLAKVSADDNIFWTSLMGLHPNYVIVGKCFSDAVWRQQDARVYRLDSTHAFDCVVTNIKDYRYAATVDQKEIFPVPPDHFPSFASFCELSIVDNDLKNSSFLRLDANFDPRYNIFRPSATYLTYCMDEVTKDEVGHELDTTFIDDDYGPPVRVEAQALDTTFDGDGVGQGLAN